MNSFQGMSQESNLNFFRTIDLVKDNRLYKVPDPQAGILPVKKILNALHQEMSQKGYTEVLQIEAYLIN